MDHPNIREGFLDAGMTRGNQESGNQASGIGIKSQADSEGNLTPDPCLLTPSGGRPYFVMELVQGMPITKYCDAQRLPLAQWLALFVQVCQACNTLTKRALFIAISSRPTC